MLATVPIGIPRARMYVHQVGVVVVLSIVLLTVMLFFPSVTGLHWTVVALEVLMGFMLTYPDDRVVPASMEHTRERLGVLILIVIGESVVSAYNERKSRGTVDEATFAHALSFIFVFMLSFLFFHTQPTPNNDDLRRSRIHAAVLMLAFKVLSVTLLSLVAANEMFVIIVSIVYSIFHKRLAQYMKHPAGNDSTGE